MGPDGGAVTVRGGTGRGRSRSSRGRGLLRSGPGWGRRLRTLTGVVLWVALVAALQFWLLPGETNPRRAALAAAVAVPASLGVAAWGFVRGYHTILVFSDVMELRRGVGSDEVVLSDVLGLVGPGGISLDGGELLVWKRVVVLTDDRRWSVSLTPAGNAALYRALRVHCRWAWGIPFRGSIEPPEEEAAARTALRRSAAFSAGNSSGRCSSARPWPPAARRAGAWLLSRPGLDDTRLKAVAWLVVGLVAGFLVLANAGRELRTLRRITAECRRWS